MIDVDRQGREKTGLWPTSWWRTIGCAMVFSSRNWPWKMALKALVCRQTRDLPPRIHNLARLVELAAFNPSAEQIDVLAEMTAVNPEGQYPDALAQSPAKQTGRPCWSG